MKTPNKIYIPKGTRVQTERYRDTDIATIRVSDVIDALESIYDDLATHSYGHVTYSCVMDDIQELINKLKGE